MWKLGSVCNGGDSDRERERNTTKTHKTSEITVTFTLLYRRYMIDSFTFDDLCAFVLGRTSRLDISCRKNGTFNLLFSRPEDSLSLSLFRCLLADSYTTMKAFLSCLSNAMHWLFGSFGFGCSLLLASTQDCGFAVCSLVGLVYGLSCWANLLLIMV